MGHAFPGVISHTAAVTAPALTVMGIILYMGKISGAHLNPAVSIAFALRRDFPWARVPGYIVVQLIGATLAALVLHAIINVSASYGSNYPAPGYSAGAAFWMELILTAGLVSVILGTASGAQNVGVIGAFGVGGYVALAGLWGRPHLGCLDEPGPHLGARPGLGHLHQLLGLHRRADRRRRDRRGNRLRPARPGAATRPLSGPRKVTCSPKATSPASPENPTCLATSMRAEGARALAGLRSGDSPPSIRVRPRMSRPGLTHVTRFAEETYGRGH